MTSTASTSSSAASDVVINTDRMDENETRFRMFTSEFISLNLIIVCNHSGNVSGAADQLIRINVYSDMDEYVFQMPGEWPRRGFLPRLAAEVFKLRLCVCKSHIVRPPHTTCVECRQAPIYASTRKCVVCFEDVSNIGKVCGTCVDGIVCHGCNLKCDISRCFICKSSYPVLPSKRRLSESD